MQALPNLYGTIIERTKMLVGGLDRLINILAVIAGILMVALTALICVDVTSRYFRLFAMPWTLDIAKYCLYGITFLGAPWVLRDGGHITIDLFVTGLSEKSRKAFSKLANGLGAIICLVLTYYACRIVYGSWSQNVMINETFVFPEWWLFALAPPIFLILFFTFLRILFAGEYVSAEDDQTPGGF